MEGSRERNESNMAALDSLFHTRACVCVIVCVCVHVCDAVLHWAEDVGQTKSVKSSTVETRRFLWPTASPPGQEEEELW